MNILYLGWAGYDFRGHSSSGITAVAVCEPSFSSEEFGNKRIITEDIGNIHIDAEVDIKNINIRGNELKPTLVAFPTPEIDN